MTNPNNHGTQIGRMAADAKIFANNDGSHNVKFSAYVQQNFKSRDGEWGSDRLPFESGYLRPETDVTKVPFANAREGDLVSMVTHIEDATYTPEGSDKPAYGIRVVVDDFWFQESKSVRDARAAEKAAKRSQDGNTAQAPAPAAQPAAGQSAQPVVNQTVPTWAQAQSAPVAAAPVSVPAQAQQAAPAVAVPQQVTVPAQAQAAAAQTRSIDDNPPF